MNLNRRQLLRNGLKAGAGFVALHQLGFGLTAFAATNSQPDTARYAAAYQRLDEFVVRHLADVGAPGLTLALVDRAGLLRTSQYGFADVKAGIKVTPQTLFGHQNDQPACRRVFFPVRPARREWRSSSFWL